jgi:hypothetical protein
MKQTIYATLLFCILQNAHSQFLYPQKEFIEYPPPYNEDFVIIGKDVEKWMAEEQARNYEKKFVEMKTDIKGRAKKNDDKDGLSIKRTEYKEVAMPKQKRKVVISDMHLREIDMEPAYARYEYNPDTKNYDYYFNGKKMSEKEYFDIIEKRNKKFDNQKKGKRNLFIPGVISSDDDRNWIALMTAEEISELIRKYKELAIDDYREPVESISDILTTLQISTHAHYYNYKGNGIGVSVVEKYCKDVAPPLRFSNKYSSLCSGANVSNHHNKVVNVVQHIAPEAHIWGFKNDNPHPSNPFSYYPPIEIGTYSYCYITNNNVYINEDMDMDNYIYLNGVINFIAAGNQGDCGPTYFVTSPGKALNAITVGAVSSYPALYNNYRSYSNWINPEVANQKPEIGMYTDINMGVYSFDSITGSTTFGGTSAATPLAAGFLADHLDQHPFCKRQPAMMKATLINSGRIPILNASRDTDNNSQVAAREIMDYSTSAWGTRSAWWNGGNSSFFNSYKEITFTENGIQAGQHYRIAIAWLSSGTELQRNNKKIPQDIDLVVMQNGYAIASSGSYNNPFEAVDFVATTNNPLTIVIRRFSNSGRDRVILGYHMKLNY